jgi:hypothetical protein
MASAMALLCLLMKAFEMVSHWASDLGYASVWPMACVWAFVMA